MEKRKRINWHYLSIIRLLHENPNLESYQISQILGADAGTTDRLHKKCIEDKELLEDIKRVSDLEKREIEDEYRPIDIKNEDTFWTKICLSVFDGLEWLRDQQIKEGNKWLGWANPRSLLLGNKSNWEFTGYCIFKFLKSYEYGIISKEEFLKWGLSERINGAINFLLKSKIENADTIAWKNPYIADTPLCPRVTGAIIYNLKYAEKFKELDFRLEKEIEQKAKKFIEDSCVEYVDKTLTPRIYLFQVPVIAILDCLRGYYSIVGKKKFLNDQFVNAAFRKLLSYYSYYDKKKKSGGFKRKPNDIEPDMETSSCVVKDLLSEEGFNLSFSDVEKLNLLSYLHEMRKFLLPEKGEKIESITFPVHLGVKILSLLLLGVHPCSSFIKSRLKVLTTAQLENKSWGSDIEQTVAVVGELLLSIGIIQRIIRNPEIYYENIRGLHFI